MEIDTVDRMVVKKKKKVIEDKECNDCHKPLKELWQKWYTVDRNGKPVCHCEKCFDKIVRPKKIVRIKAVADDNI